MVPGLFKSPHAAAVALAQWKQQLELGLEELEPIKKPRAKRGSLRPKTHQCFEENSTRPPVTPHLALQPFNSVYAVNRSNVLCTTPVTVPAVPLTGEVAAMVDIAVASAFPLASDVFESDYLGT